jgi:hypothetical protein
MNFAFFLFPFFLYVGIAVQGFSYYLIGILAPSLYFIYKNKKIPNYFISIGLTYIYLHIVFPIVNFIIYLFPNRLVSQSIYQISLKWPGILQSNFPSTFFFGGLALVIFAFISCKKFNSNKLNTNLKFMPLKMFLLGLFPASLVFLGILLYSHFTGIDLHTIFRSHIGYLDKLDAFHSGRYRVYGFYGHPLTVAGVCLTYSIFTWSLFNSFATTKNIELYHFLPFYKNKFICLFVLTIVTFTNEICLFLSGGRTAAVAGLVLLIFIPIFYIVKYKLSTPSKNIFSLQTLKFFILSIIAVSVISISSYFIAKNVGLLERIQLTTNSYSKSSNFDKGNNRQFFWRTYERMFLDNPVFGQGNYWLKEGVREEYYDKIMGYANLSEKYIAHNVYLEILGATGLFGFVWIICGLIYYIRILRKNIFYKTSSLNSAGLALSFAFLANLIHSLTQNVFFDSSVVYIYISLVVVLMWEKATSI